ncbi:PAC2 family protein [Brachybacterium ginsengisoli]|uniref:PAC2 family protein n=1 Tax=Brachybacterium ginsengisoli TaxID=1331682 RepID=A0A291GXQ8_9MICO|nr:PAC2 family protein [Brachybacterium ginsengisoli]ATG54874.1 PAC2 family protein [Brachybacterium ginsengisoli]
MDPTTLFSYERHVDSRSLQGRTLLVTLGAYSDAGESQQLIDDQLLNSLSSRVVGRLDMDQVYDYAGHRPEVTLQLDHFSDYERPEILLHEVTALDGETFFLLSGPEPSFQWERVAGALQIVVEQLGIERTLLLQSFPAPVPHTRELPVTRFAGDPESIVVRRTMPGTFRLRAPFTALLTLRLAEAGHDVVGLTVHVPQYLHEMSYPDAAIALLGAITEEQGPQLPTDSLEAQAGPVREAVAAQIDAQPALQEMVSGLETRFDRMITSGAGAEVPTAEAIAAEVEQYLASFDQEDGEGPAA